MGLWPLAGLAAIGLLALVTTFLKTGVVSGKVTRTINLSTQGMLTGQKDVPVAGTPVSLYTPDGNTELYRTTSDSGGHYMINGPTIGEYKLFAHDTEPQRGSGQWVSDTVRVASHLSGEGLGTSNLTLPTYREDTGSVFLDEAPGGGAPASPGGAAGTGGGTQGQMQRMLNDATGGAAATP